MEQYISKSALAAEIEKLKAYLQIPNAQLEAIKVCDNVINVIDTLEVKELDSARENLTWKDIRELYIIFAEIDAEIEFCKTDIQEETIGYYQEALKRFNAQKGK